MTLKGFTGTQREVDESIRQPLTAAHFKSIHLHGTGASALLRIPTLCMTPLCGDKTPEASPAEDLERQGLSEVFQTSVAAAGWNWFTWGRKENSSAERGRCHVCALLLMRREGYGHGLDLARRFMSSLAERVYSDVDVCLIFDECLSPTTLFSFCVPCVVLSRCEMFAR